ncbi:MAG: UbiD family decarboxylase [Candidatus Bathyarchaeota archaeon]
MSFRSFLDKLDKEGQLVKVKEPVSKKLEASGIISELDYKPVLFEKIKESDFKVAGNICTSKRVIANYFDLGPEELIVKMIKAIDSPSKPEIVNTGPCQEVTEQTVDLDKLPILFHCAEDGGNYLSSGVFIVRDLEYGQNLSYHRGMQLDKNKFVIRVVAHRDFDTYLKRNNGELDVAVCIGNPVNVLLTAATSVEIEKDELGIANSLESLKIVKAKTVDVYVPVESEFILEGRVTKETHAEGPFVDLTETYDTVREQPIFEVKKITHRKDAIWQALLPGKLEHRILMGTPREPTIYKEVNKVCRCVDVNITPGGCSWLHAIVKIDKQSEKDGRLAIDAAFQGHKSLKHVFIVDNDIDISNPLEVEWALALRFQGNKDLVIKEKQIGSTLDKSADPQTKETTKVGFDLTKPLGERSKLFEKVKFPKVDLHKYIG